ncbi:MAG: hypothetical protein ACRDOM_10735 [Nocardioides sp.]
MTATVEEDRGGGRWRRIDPLGPLLAVAAFGVFMLYGFEGYLTRDLGLYAYSALQVAEGVPPYESVLNRAGPLAHLVPALGVPPARLAGIEELTGIRVAVALVSAAGVWALYLLGRDVHRSRIAGAVAASALLTFEGVVAMSASGPRDKPIMLAFLTLALLAMVRRSWLVAGVLVACATLTWQPAFLVASPVAVVVIVTLRDPDFGRALVRFAVGGTAPAALCVLGFWLTGALQELIEGFVILPMRYTGFAPFTRTAEKNALELVAGFGPGLWVLLAGLVATLVAAVVTVVARIRAGPDAAEPTWVDRLALGIGCAAGLALCLRAFDSWPDAFALLPFAALGAGTIAHALIRAAPPRAGRVLGAALCVVTLVLAGLSAWSNRADRLTEPRAATVAVMGALPEDATVMSVEVPQALVFSGKTNPTRHQIFVSRLKNHIDDRFPGGMPGFVARLRAEPPTVIVTRPSTRNRLWLEPTLSRGYTEIGDGTAATFYVHRSLGSATIHRARAALHEVMGASGE